MRKIFVFLCVTTLLTTTVCATTCTPGYYPSNGECTICPQYYACPDGENVIFCTEVSPAQYTDGPGATECINCPTQVNHTDGFRGVFHNRGENPGITGCRAEWKKKKPHGEILFSCYYTPANGYDNDSDDGTSRTRCMIDIISCNAGYVSAIKGFTWAGIYYPRYWTATYDAAIQETCQPAGIGFYSPESALTANACPDGTSTHTDTATSVDECEPLCRAGMSKIHIGNHAFNIWPNRQSAPSLNVLAPNGDVCYVNMVPGTGTVNVELGDTQYHISN